MSTRGADLWTVPRPVDGDCTPGLRPDMLARMRALSRLRTCRPATAGPGGRVASTWWEWLALRHDTVAVLTAQAAACQLRLETYVATVLTEIAEHGRTTIDEASLPDAAVVPLVRARDPSPAA